MSCPRLKLTKVSHAQSAVRRAFAPEAISMVNLMVQPDCLQCGEVAALVCWCVCIYAWFWLLFCVTEAWVEKPSFGKSLEEHLNISGREIAFPIEACVTMLLECGMQEEVEGTHTYTHPVHLGVHISFAFYLLQLWKNVLCVYFIVNWLKICKMSLLCAYVSYHLAVSDAQVMLGLIITHDYVFSVWGL